MEQRKEWKNAGAELPPEWKSVVSQHHKDMLAHRGLGRYAWCVAVEVTLCMPAEELRKLASQLREDAEQDWDSFARKWDEREKTAKALRPHLLKLIAKAFSSSDASQEQVPAKSRTGKSKKSKKSKKFEGKKP